MQSAGDVGALRAATGRGRRPIPRRREVHRPRTEGGRSVHGAAWHRTGARADKPARLKDSANKDERAPTYQASAGTARSRTVTRRPISHIGAEAVPCETFPPLGLRPKMKRLPPRAKRQRLEPVTELHRDEPPSCGCVGSLAPASRRRARAPRRRRRQRALLLFRTHHLQHVEQQNDTRGSQRNPASIGSMTSASPPSARAPRRCEAASRSRSGDRNAAAGHRKQRAGVEIRRASARSARVSPCPQPMSSSVPPDPVTADTASRG